MNWKFWEKECRRRKRRTTKIKGPGVVGCHLVCSSGRYADPLADYGSLYDPHTLHGKFTPGR